MVSVDTADTETATRIPPIVINLPAGEFAAHKRHSTRHFQLAAVEILAAPACG